MYMDIIYLTDIMWYSYCHLSLQYVDAAYCYRRSSVVCLSVGRSVTVLSRTKTAEPIEMPFKMRTWVNQRNYVLDAVQVPLAKGQF